MDSRKVLSGTLAALAAILALAGTASATTLTSPEGTTYTGEVVATSTNSEFDGAFVTIKCSDIEAAGAVEQHGAVNAGGQLTTLKFMSCNYHTTVDVAGALLITSTNEVLSTGAEFHINTSVGTCVLTTNVSKGTYLGTLTEGKNASWNINAAKIPRTGGNFLCGSSLIWTGSFDFTTPNDLWVD